MDFDFEKIENKWRKKWDELESFKSKESKKEKFYALSMFPYPSSYGLHMGHVVNYNLTDIYARFMRLKGKEVLQPFGFDSFGLPAENAAIKDKSHPREYTEKAIVNFIKQVRWMGCAIDWDTKLETHKPEFYGWDQWIFLKMFEKGLAYKKKSPVNWCPVCKTVLANEQVENGKCWRHDSTNVQIKHLEQWFFKITDYAEELYEQIDKLKDWPEQIKKLQRNWIGKSSGAEIDFFVNGERWKVFTTRPDTLMGVTFLVVSAQHTRLMDITSMDRREEVENFVSKIKSVKEEDIDVLEKEGVFTGSYALHPLTGEKIPIWTGNFVLAEYGSGMVMAVPAHDSRDYEFARKYGLEIKEVIESEQGVGKKAYIGAGRLVNSGKFDGLINEEAKEEIVKEIEFAKLGRKAVNYRLRDWLISRQRYWGTPIPIVYCDKCGIVPVPERELPVRLPEKFIVGEGNPLEKDGSFVNCKCYKCGGKAKRETDTMDTFVNSSWYFFRYCDSKNKEKIFDSKKVNRWCPIDLYIGGKEHACMHLIYCRFYTKFLRDLGLVEFDEPVYRLFNQGFLLGNDGDKMSKSKGNVIVPDEIFSKYGVDASRFFVVSVASPDKDFSWSETGIESSLRFIQRVWNRLSNLEDNETERKMESKLNDFIIKIEKDIKDFNFNLAVIKLRDLFDSIDKLKISKMDAIAFLKMLSVFCPYITEELHELLGGKGSIANSEWPKADETKIDEKYEKAERAIENTVKDVLNVLKIVKDRGKEANKIYLYVIPNELEFYNLEEISLKIGKQVIIYKVNDSNKYDPESKASKAKFGKPAIFVE